jgi:outer membrane protein assembly factor BamB
MKYMLRIVAVVAAVAVSAGCAWFTKDKSKMAQLTDIPHPVTVNRLWQTTVGSTGSTRRWWDLNPFAVDPIHVFVPAVAGGSVFAATPDGSLARYDVNSGAQAWHIQTGQRLTGGVGSNGSVVVVGTGKGAVLAYDGDGKQLWTADVSSEILSPPAVGSDLVVVRTSDSRTYGLDSASGKRRWSLQRASPALIARSNAGAVLAGSSVYEGLAGGKLIAISAATGAISWEATVSTPRGTTELERISDVTSLPAVIEGVICAVAFQGRLSCFDAANGNPLWSRDVSSAAGLAIDVRYVFVADDKGSLQAFDRATGTSAWKTDKLSLRQLTAPVSQGRFVVVADVKGYIHFVDREDGALVGRIETDGSPVYAALKTADRVLVAQTSKGGLFAVSAQ